MLDESNRRDVHVLGLRLALVYAVAAAAWIVISDQALAFLDLSAGAEQVLSSAKGLLFVLVTATVLYGLEVRQLSEIGRVRAELRKQEEGIRQAYVDVLDAVTGGKLVLVTEKELSDALGEPLMPQEHIESPAQLAEARTRIRGAVASRYPALADSPDLLQMTGEGLNNALKHAGRGTYQVLARDGIVQVEITDEGPGIDFHTLPKAALVTGFSTAATMGLGFTIMLQLSDRLLLSTRPSRTALVLEVRADGSGDASTQESDIMSLLAPG